jgi:hypothetical protein
MRGRNGLWLRNRDLVSLHLTASTVRWFASDSYSDSDGIPGGAEGCLLMKEVSKLLSALDLERVL